MKVAVSTVVLFVIWVIMTQSFDSQELAVGLIVSAIISLIAPGVQDLNRRNGLIQRDIFMHSFTYSISFLKWLRPIL